MSIASMLAVACLACILTVQLMIPPIIGLANQGDFARLIGYFGYGPSASTEPPYYSYVHRLYVPDPTFRLQSLEFFTSEYIFAWLAVHINALIGSREHLDLRVIGSIHIAALLAVVGLLLQGLGRLLPVRAHVMVCIATVLVLGDTAYAVYLNSFFSEPATLLFLLLTAAVWVHVLAGATQPAVLLALGAAGALFVTAKPQNCIAGPVLALAVARFWFRVGEAKQRLALAACVVIILGAAVFSYMAPPASYGIVAAYNELFMGILPVSPEPKADLRWFGLTPELSDYSGTGAFSPKTALQLPGFLENFPKRVTHGKLALFYLQHPSRAMAHIRTILPLSLSLRPEFCGNFERSTVIQRKIREPLARSYAFSLWSDMRDKAPVHRHAGWILAMMLASIPVAIALAFRNRASPNRELWEMYAALATLAGLAFLSAMLADAWDNVKHLFLYNLLLDTSIIFVLPAAVLASAKCVATPD